MRGGSGFKKTLAAALRRLGARARAVAACASNYETAPPTVPRRAPTDFSEWMGLGLNAPENPGRQFETDEDLWS